MMVVVSILRPKHILKDYMNIHTVENPNGEIRGTASIPP
jgi:hypothetical protein